MSWSRSRAAGESPIETSGGSWVYTLSLSQHVQRSLTLTASSADLNTMVDGLGFTQDYSHVGFKVGLMPSASFGHCYDISNRPVCILYTTKHMYIGSFEYWQLTLASKHNNMSCCAWWYILRNSMSRAGLATKQREEHDDLFHSSSCSVSMIIYI